MTTTTHNYTKNIAVLHRVYVATLRHHNFVFSKFVSGVYDLDHSGEIYELDKRVFWATKLCEFAHVLFDKLLDELHVPLPEMRKAWAYASATRSLAQASLSFFKAYVRSACDVNDGLFEQHIRTMEERISRWV